MKTVSLIFHFLGNVMSEGIDYILKIVRETSLICAMQHIVTNNLADSEELAERLSTLCHLMLKCWLTPQSEHDEQEAIETVILTLNYILEKTCSKALVI